jgi:hypothetical protein
MKKPFIFPAVIAAIALFSCQKQQTEAEKNAEIDRKVQERLAAEHQAEQQQQLDQRQAEVDAREKALVEKENTAAATPARGQRSESESYEPRAREPREGGPARGYSTFYNRLDPYGDWIEAGDYGYVFHPREAESSRSWRPYTNGRWVYTDAGWTWISEEPFGWATYHYGRWTRLRGVGWVWVPGSQWAPAWVSWRKSNDYVGWAPLPPEARFDQRTGIHNWSDSYYDVGPDQYCFVASREFGAPRVEQTLLPPERNVTIINQTTNVTNITYNNTTVVNEGPNYDEMRTQSREPMQRLRLERNVSVDVNVEAPRPLVQGETVIVAAPVIAAPQASERPRAVKQNIAQVTVDLGWAAIANQEEAKKARQKMKSEATPPPNAPSKKFLKAEAILTAPTQSAEASTTSTSATVTSAPSIAATTTPVAAAAAISTPQMTTTPRRAATVARAATVPATSTPVSAAPVSPTAAQRRGPLLIPSATPSPQITPAPTAKTAVTAPNSRIPEAISLTPIPSASVADGTARQEITRRESKSQTQSFNPRKAEPMASASPNSTPEASHSGWRGKGFKVPNDSSSPRAKSTSPAATESSSVPPSGKLSKQEKKEIRRGEKQEMKRQHTEGTETPSPSPAP